MDRLFDLAVMLEAVMAKRLAGHRIIPARAEVLWVIHRGGWRMQRELSHILKCTPLDVTGRVDVVEGAGFAERSARPTDRRSGEPGAAQPGRGLRQPDTGVMTVTAYTATVRIVGNETGKGLRVMWVHKVPLALQLTLMAANYWAIQFFIGGGRFVPGLLAMTLAGYLAYVVSYIATPSTRRPRYRQLDSAGHQAARSRRASSSSRDKSRPPP